MEVSDEPPEGVIRGASGGHPEPAHETAPDGHPDPAHQTAPDAPALEALGTCAWAADPP